MPSRERAGQAEVSSCGFTDEPSLHYVPLFHNIFVERYEQMAEQEESNYQQLRRKLYTELQQERDKLVAEVQGHKDATESQMKELKVQAVCVHLTKMCLFQLTHNSEIMKLKSDHESALSEIQRRHSVW